MSNPRPQSTKRTTIKDVAQAAGVSVTTVSNVLNNRTEAMADHTLHRVQAAIRSLTYHPSRIARRLVTSKTGTIGVIVNEISTPLFLQVLNIIEPIARDADHNILLGLAHNLEDEEQAVNLLLEKEVDGIIFLSNSFYLADDFLARLFSAGPPLVLVNRVTTYDRFDRIEFDNLGGIINALNHLVELGHSRIAHLYGRVNRRSFGDRLQGYCCALEEHHLEYNEEYVRLTDYEAPKETWERTTQDLLAVSPRPTAIIATNDVIAATVMRTVQRAGLRVPEDISIVGVDDQHFCSYLNPALTSVQIPIIEAGKRAIELLLARINGRQTDPEQLTLPCPLIVRESTGQVPA